MLKDGIESLASSADSIDASEESIDYAKMIETFRRYDKKCCGYLTKAQYKKFLRDMKIYQTDEFGEITFRALITENQENDLNYAKAKNKTDEANTNSLKNTLPISIDTAPGITFEMARVIVESFGSSSFRANPQQHNKSRRSSNASSQSNNLNSTHSNDNANEGEKFNVTRTSSTQLPPSTTLNASNDGNINFERNSSAPLPIGPYSNDYLPLRRGSKTKSEKNNIKTKICSLILFRGVDINRDGKIDFDQFKSIAKIVDPNMNDGKIALVFNSCLPDPNDHLVTYANVAKQLFDVFVWGNEDPYQQKIVNNAPISRICILI